MANLEFTNSGNYFGSATSHTQHHKPQDQPVPPTSSQTSMKHPFAHRQETTCKALLALYLQLFRCSKRHPRFPAYAACQAAGNGMAVYIFHINSPPPRSIRRDACSGLRRRDTAFASICESGRLRFAFTVNVHKLTVSVSSEANVVLDSGKQPRLSKLLSVPARIAKIPQRRRHRGVGAFCASSRGGVAAGPLPKQTTKDKRKPNGLSLRQTDDGFQIISMPLLPCLGILEALLTASLTAQRLDAASARLSQCIPRFRRSHPR